MCTDIDVVAMTLLCSCPLALAFGMRP